MPDSLCRLTVACCTDAAHRAVDVELPADIDIGRLLPQLIDIVYTDTPPKPGRDWRLSRLGESAMDDSETLNDNHIRDGDMLVLTTSEPSKSEWTPCDPCHAMAASAAPPMRMPPAISCVVLGGLGAAILAWPTADIATTTRTVIGGSSALAAAAGASAARRLHSDPAICVTLSVLAVLYAGAVGFLTGRAGTTVSGLLLAAAAMFAASLILLRVTGCGRTCLTAMATLSALLTAASAVGVSGSLQLGPGGATLVVLSLATLSCAPRLSMALTGTTPEMTPDAGCCHRTLTGLISGSAMAAALGAAAVAIGEVHNTGAVVRGASFIGTVALVLLLRVRSHVDGTRRSGLVAAAVVCAGAGFAAIAISAPAQAHVVSALAAAAGATALACLIGPRMSPIALRTVEVVEYVALAAVVPLACWVCGVYGWVRGMNLL